ncbi:MAG: family 78 glycoside hydrolase catalytic domain [Alistipes sp.]|nr:family 78 glycoside hydrolase catalytic domain [Alistipes sp.]
MRIKNLISVSVAACLSFVLAVGCCCDCDKGVGERVDALDNSAWEASEWISVVDAPIAPKVLNLARAADGANWFLSTLSNEKRVVSAKWMTTGLGVYELYVNGKRVGDDFMKPGYTSPIKTKISFTYDITDAFNTKAGAENTLSAQVTPGWWADRVISPRNNVGMTGEKCAFRAVLELTFADGSKRLYGTNLTDWKAGIAGPVKHAGIYDGEEYDAREKLGFETPEKLSTPELNKEFNGEIVPTAGAEVCLRHDLTLLPVRTYVYNGVEGASEEAYGKVIIVREYEKSQVVTLDKGETLVVDFGQNCAAVPEFEFRADEGVVLTCLPAEILNDGNGAKSRLTDGPEGSCHHRNIRGQKDGIRVIYTFAGSDFATYMPRCTFFGYRYIAVTATGKVEFKSIKSIPVTSITREMEIGKITTGNELINKLISNTYWGEVSNYLSVPTDCPQRNERLGWTADTQVFAEAGSFAANTNDFLRKWMRDMRDAQLESGAYPSIAPEGAYGGTFMRLGWADAGVIVPWVVWKQFGNTRIIDENWESMEKFMNHVAETKYDHQALIKENKNKQYADWVSYEPMESHFGLHYTESSRNSKKKVVSPEAIGYWNYLSACYWVIDATYMADMAKATGRCNKKYLEMVDEAKAHAKSFLNEDGTFKNEILNTMQTPALFALKTELVEGEAKADMVARLRKNFEEHGNCLQTGFLGTGILMSTLTENGMVDMAYELLFQRKNPSWLYSIDNGATTIWERWDSYTIEKGIGKGGMNSFNHYAYGCVCEWIWETAAGISSDISAPGFKHIVMKPVPDKRLGFVEAEYNSAAGLIKSAWRYKGDEWIWEFTIPEGSTASVTLPGESEATLYKSGSYKIVR